MKYLFKSVLEILGNYIAWKQDIAYIQCFSIHQISSLMLTKTILYNQKMLHRKRKDNVPKSYTEILNSPSTLVILPSNS